VSRVRRLAPLVVVIGLGGCTIPQWNPAWVPAWVPYLGTDRGDTPPPRRITAAPPRVIERPPVTADDDDILDRVIAVVNNDAITLGELEEAMIVARQSGQQRPQGTDEQVRREFLNRFIEARLQLQEAEREKIGVDDAEIDEELLDRVKKSNLKDIEEFKAILKNQGISYDSIRKRLRDNIKLSKVVRRKVTIRVSVTDPEIERYLEENRDKLETGLGYHARHILIVPEGASTDAAWEAARIKAELVRSQLRDGGDFAELAKKFSADATAKDGGDLGTLKRGELSQDIESRILALKSGAVSEPYRSDLGYHIFRLESKDGLEGEGLTRARGQIREILFRQKYEARLDAWLREIRERAVIEVRM
jgi:peptidyl-prolyl cis-trans isomerase SurA